MAWRYYAQRARTNEWLDRDLQLQNVNITWTLSGPSELTATVDGATASQIATDGSLLLDEWSTFVYAENNNQILFGGIMTGSSDVGLGARDVTFNSFSSYPTGRIWLGELTLYVTDAFDIIRVLWDAVQSDPNGNIGIAVSENLANYVIGSADPGPRPEQGVGESNEDYEVRLEAWQVLINEPYELAWWNNQDCGNEIDNILQQSHTDYLERHEWDDNRENVFHYIDLLEEGWMVRRNDLRFMEGENIKVAPLPERDGEEYANFVKGIGVGDDRFAITYEAYGVDDGKLRRDKIYSAKNILVPETLAAKTNDELRASQQIVRFDTIEVVDHPHAVIGSWSLGNEILVQTHSGFEKLYDWMRITEWSFSPDVPDVAVLKLIRPADVSSIPAVGGGDDSE